MIYQVLPEEQKAMNKELLKWVKDNLKDSNVYNIIFMLKRLVEELEKEWK